MSVDEMLALIPGEDIEAELFGTGKHGLPPLLANGIPVCPVGIPRGSDVALIEMEAACREYGVSKPRTAWAVQAYQAIAYERSQLTSKAIKRSRNDN